MKSNLRINHGFQLSATTHSTSRFMSTNVQPRNKIRNVFNNDEDEQIRQLVSKYGCENWKQVAADLPGRTARQCRERWISYLAPHIHNDPWTLEEDRLLRQKVKIYGHRWRELEMFFPNRSDINLKNRWRQLKSQTIFCPVPWYKHDDKLELFDRVFLRILIEDTAKLETNHESCRFTINMFW
jgi:hypothetical protein